MTELLLAALLTLASAPAPGPADPPPRAYGLELDPSSRDTLSAVFVGPADGLPAGEFRGKVSISGAEVEVPLAGRATRQGGRLRIAVRVRYADVPESWSAVVRPDAVEYRLSGIIGGGAGSGAATVDWQARLAWTQVAVTGGTDAANRFVSLHDVEMTSLSPGSSHGVARVKVVNPFSFPLRIALTQYTIEAASREIGRGGTRGLLLRPRFESTLEFPIELDHGRVIGAAGRAIFSGGEIDVRLRGTLTLRLARGDVRVPLDLEGKLDISP